MDVPVPAVNPEQLRNVGQRLQDLFEKYKKDRFNAEGQWLRNMRQFRGIYDPEIERRINVDQSKAYPKITRNKVVGTIARLMEMLFPQTEKNWNIICSPLPDLSTSDLQTVLDKLTEEKGPDLSDVEIERAIFDFAKVKSEAMSKVIEDQLDEIEYVTLARKVVFSAVLYSVGILKGPNMITRKSRTWHRDPSGKLTALEQEKYFPVYEHISVWDWYPDLSAKTFKQMDGSFFRHIMSRAQFTELAKRPDFMQAAIKSWLRSHTSGNYKELHWETELRTTGDRQSPTDLSGRKYELWEWWGSVPGHELKAAGIAVSDEQLATEFEANVWGIGSEIIKAKLNPYEKRNRPVHTFVYEEDDINLLGNGVPNIIRDSQLAICEATRMMLDNASAICGPMLEMNTDLLVPGQSLDIHAFKIFLREGQGNDAGVPAVRNIQVDGHLAELQNIVSMFRDMADTETALPPQALGDVTRGGSEALRTQGNLSMLLGASALPIRDTVRNFDTFTTSFIGSLYYWNMEFDDREEIKGDFTVIARGSTSLIAKEVRSIALDQFSATLTPEERAYLNTEKVLMERMKVRDLPLELLEDPEVVKEKLNEQAARAQKAEAQADRMTDAQVREMIAGAFKDFALAMKANASANIDTFKAVVEATENGEDKGGRAGAQTRGESGSA